MLVTLADCAAQVTDLCDGALDPNRAGTILSASSDEPEDALGNGDGKTTRDMVILGNSSLWLRAERQGEGNRRVYSIVYSMVDRSGNRSLSTCRVGVAHDPSGAAPIDDGAGAGYTAFSGTAQ